MKKVFKNILKNRGVDKMNWRKIIYSAIFLTFLFLAPALPGVAMWVWLSPVTFWQKFAIFIVSGMFYILVFEAILIVFDIYIEWGW